MARKNCTPEENARREKIRELLQMANISSMDDIQNLFKETIAEFMENSLEAELDDELGYSKYDYKNKKHRQQPQRPQQQNSAEDWKDLAHAVSQYAVLLEGAQYSVFVFQLYEKYIRASAASMQGAASDKIVEAIAKLADELHEKESLFQNGDLLEAAYIEDCLWISLEAMIKLIASTASLFCGHQTAEFADALASCAFEYGRLMLYRKEQMLIDGFIQSQYCLDAELEKQYAAYLSELETQSKQFYALIDHAFAPDFRTAFLHSILLANAAGVKKAEILSSVEDIDSFFLN